VTPNAYLKGTYSYALQGFLEADPQAAEPNALPIIPAAAGVVPPAALDAWIPDSTGKQRQAGHYPYHSLGYVTFDGNGKLAGVSLGVSIAGNVTAATPPRPFDPGSWYDVSSDYTWGRGELFSFDSKQPPVRHSLEFRFVIVDSARALEFIITKSAPRRATASGIMRAQSDPLFGPLYKFLHPFMLWR